MLALDLIRKRNSGREVPFYGHPGMYATRAVKYPDGSMRLIEDIPSVEALTAHGAKVINTTEPQNLLDNMFYISGEIPRVTAFEYGLPTQHRQTSDGSWEPDPLVMDFGKLGR
jgi:7,8-dihydropterin-6-yl-methyl-4-(beta-D-ribofuranosyl)aminobenzene 5'-phosphate synthase